MSGRIRVVRTQPRAAGGSAKLPGMPAPLPPGETLLWQGAPCWRLLALRVLHVRKLALYFTALGAGLLFEALRLQTAQAWSMLAGLLLLGSVAIGLLAGFAYLVHRTSRYTITDRRIVLHVGVALSMDINLPFAAVQSAALRLRRDGSGDIPIRLAGPTRMGITLLWPHVRPWRTRNVEPMLRALPDAAAVAQLLARALAASAAQAVPALPQGEPAVSGAALPVAA